MKQHFAMRDIDPGIVLPSTLAALGAADGKQPTLVIKVDAHTTSIAILNEDQLQLFRTLENTRGVTITGEQLAEEVYPSVVFFQDTYHLNIERIYVAGLPESGGAAPALRAQTGAEVQELVASSQLGASAGGSVPRWRMAGVVGALISVAAVRIRHRATNTELLCVSISISRASRTKMRGSFGCAGARLWAR